MATSTFYVFRHGETDWNRLGRMQGSADIPLNSLGVAQAESLRSFFDGQEFAALKSDRVALLKSVVSSPLMRARETLRLALRMTETEGALIRTDARWAETHLGQAEGMTREELTATFGEDIWLGWIGLGQESWHAKFPGGETKGEVRDRALAAFEDLANESERGGPTTWFVASHGGLLRRVLHHYHPEVQTPIDVVNGAVFKFVRENGVWSVAKDPVYLP